MSCDARSTYDAFAPFYDAFTADHDYETWTRDLEALALRAGLDGRRLLDVACGTGKSFLPFLARGYAVTACDISPEMVARAAEKAAGRAAVFAQDMRSLPEIGAFDLILCLDDALNYLLEDDELTAALTAMRANLAPRGVLVFDVNALATYRGFFSSLHVVPASDLVLVWRGRTPPDFPSGGRAAATTQALRREDDGAWREAEQTHLQRHRSEREVRDAARTAGLRIEAVYGLTPDGTMRRGFEETRHAKAVYVAVAADQDHMPGTGTRGS